MQASGREWPDWVGGLTMIVVTSGPTIVAATVAGERHTVAPDVITVVAVVAALLLLALVAPLVGRSRRYVLWCLVPFWGLVISYRFGAALARLSSSGRFAPVAPERGLETSGERA